MRPLDFIKTYGFNTITGGLTVVAFMETIYTNKEKIKRAVLEKEKELLQEKLNNEALQQNCDMLKEKINSLENEVNNLHTFCLKRYADLQYMAQKIENTVQEIRLKKSIKSDIYDAIANGKGGTLMENLAKKEKISKEIADLVHTKRQQESALFDLIKEKKGIFDGL